MHKITLTLDIDAPDSEEALDIAQRAAGAIEHFSIGDDVYPIERASVGTDPRPMFVITEAQSYVVRASNAHEAEALWRDKRSEIVERAGEPTLSVAGLTVPGKPDLGRQLAEARFAMRDATLDQAQLIAAREREIIAAIDAAGGPDEETRRSYEATRSALNGH